MKRDTRPLDGTAAAGRSHSIAKRVARMLRQEIVAGGIAAGAKIAEQATAARLGVSRVPVREALKELEREGLLVRSATGRLRVATLGPSDMAEILELRRVIEPAVARGAATRRLPEDLAALERNLAGLRAATDLARVSILDRLVMGERRAADVLGGAAEIPLRTADPEEKLADNINHTGAALQICTGEQAFSRPSMGSWITYGLGTENANLPAFVVMSPASVFQGAPLYSASFLPGGCAGTLIRDLDRPIANLADPNAVGPRQRRQLDALAALDRLGRGGPRPDAAALDARIASFELAFRMQAEAPEAFDLARPRCG